jgi:hypothetical protein
MMTLTTGMILKVVVQRPRLADKGNRSTAGTSSIPGTIILLTTDPKSLAHASGAAPGGITCTRFIRQQYKEGKCTIRHLVQPIVEKRVKKQEPSNGRWNWRVCPHNMSEARWRSYTKRSSSWRSPGKQGKI